MEPVKLKPIGTISRSILAFASIVVVQRRVGLRVWMTMISRQVAARLENERGDDRSFEDTRGECVACEL